MKQENEILIFKQTLQVPYNYSAGPVVSRFLLALKDEKKILGIKCPRCNLVYVPPRATCGRCGSEMSEWIELSGRGTLESFTVVNYSEPTHPVKAPFILGIIKLEGADTGFTHLIGEAQEKDLKIGMKLGPVFQEERKGHILDIKYFKPLASKITRRKRKK